MAEFTAKDVKALRDATGAGMMDAKKALTEADGDMEQAVQLLRERGLAKAADRSERENNEGAISLASNGAAAAIVQLRTETDFTAKSDGFVTMADDIARLSLAQPAGAVTATDEIAKRIDDVRLTTKENVNLSRGMRLDGGSFGSYLHHDGKRAALVQIDGSADAETLKGICQHIVFHDPKGISQADIPAETLDKIRADAIKEAQASGKPEQIAQKIAEGKVRKFLEENTLLNQKYVLDETKPVKDILPKGAAIRGFIRYTLGA